MEGVPPEVEALLWGVISALALPLGALVSFAKKKPSLRVRAGLMAFGAGALLFALAIELFGETVCEHKQDEDYIIIVAVMAGAAILGGLAFQGIEHLINSKGGFFRSLSTKFSFIQARKEKAWE
jgi:zinc transporter ZupT